MVCGLFLFRGAEVGGFIFHKAKVDEIISELRAAIFTDSRPFSFATLAASLGEPPLP